MRISETLTVSDLPDREGLVELSIENMDYVDLDIEAVPSELSAMLDGNDLRQLHEHISLLLHRMYGGDNA